MSLVSVGIPNASTTIFQGMLLVFYLACYLFVNYRVQRSSKLTKTIAAVGESNHD
jgi:ABC-type uncharacterized transport system permease subunit